MSEQCISVVSADWLADHRESVTVVDVRPPREYREVGHVPAAVNLPYEAVRNPAGGTAGHLPDPETFAALCGESGIERDDTLVCYDGGTGVHAARVLVTALALGHEGDLRLLDGGYRAWNSAYATETGERFVEAAPYRAHPPGDPVADRETVEAAIEDEATVLVDTRTAAEFDAAHIPGAVYLAWEECVEDGTIRSRAQVEALLADRGITPDRRIVLYCNTARRVSHTYVVLSDLGFADVAIYEGSLTDWIRSQSAAWSPGELETQVREYADRGFEALVADHDGIIDRLKLVGLYHQKQRGYFMLRTKVPGGHLTAEQARVVGQVADEFARAPSEHGGREQNPEWGDGYLDITTRQDIQMHWIRLADIPAIWDRYEAVDLTTMQACGNSVRNVVACPAAGLDPAEEFDARTVADDVTERFLEDDHYANLPRKFKLSVTGCHENCARAEINDLGLLPARKGDRTGFNAVVGGGLSDGPRMARDLDVFVEPDDVVSLVEATADVFIEYGSYLDTAVNRLRFLVAELGVDRVREEIAARIDGDLEPAGESLTERYRGDHVGVHEQRDGRRYVGLCVPVGRMGGDEFAEVATLATAYGQGELRLTLNQNLLVPGIDSDRVESFRAEPVVEQYPPDPGPFTRGVVACTGREYCTYGIVETKARASTWARTLDEWYAQTGGDRDVLRLHFSGCSASCAQPQIADIGLRGEERRTEDGCEPAVDIGLGGDLEAGRFVDWVAGSHPTADLPATVKRLVVAAEESDADSVAAWVESTPRAELYDLVTAPPAAVGGD